MISTCTRLVKPVRLLPVFRKFQLAWGWLISTRLVKPVRLLPVFRKFPQSCLRKGPNVPLTDNFPTTSFRGKSSTNAPPPPFFFFFYTLYGCLTFWIDDDLCSRCMFLCNRERVTYKESNIPLQCPFTSCQQKRTRVYITSPPARNSVTVWTLVTSSFEWIEHVNLNCHSCLFSRVLITSPPLETPLKIKLFRQTILNKSNI